ncbi:uncharacterized protein LOC122632196 isoform X3 [Vespula pensylvanica]|uniref:uncharacterized protein LOC122632196 isoform X3 n=1 Tax=Vespula pensylvanica TaxID=30213 RepID=UPI001CB9FF9D|nr:uncharacterized protein LOC122632196 isoform X3 [Vespula pensylvanica]
MSPYHSVARSRGCARTRSRVRRVGIEGNVRPTKLLLRNESTESLHRQTSRRVDAFEVTQAQSRSRASSINPNSGRRSYGYDISCFSKPFFFSTVVLIVVLYCRKKKMAIPFMQPTEEDQELSNQQLQIMMALYMALQQVLRSRSFRHSSRNRKTMAPSLLESATTAIYYTTQRNTTTCSSVTRSDLFVLVFFFFFSFLFLFSFFFTFSQLSKGSMGHTEYRMAHISFFFLDPPPTTGNELTETMARIILCLGDRQFTSFLALSFSLSLSLSLFAFSRHKFRLASSRELVKRSLFISQFSSYNKLEILKRSRKSQ